MYTLSRKVIIRKWGRAGTSVHFPFTVMVKRRSRYCGSKGEAKRMIGRFLSMRAAHPFLIYSI